MALLAAHSAAAQPRVRRGVIPLQKPGAGRVRVVVSLGLPPLALHGDRGLATAVARRKLDVHTSSSRAYLHMVEAAQARAVAELHAAIPSARVQERFRVVLDALTVSLPYAKLPALMRQGWAAHVYPSLQYTVKTNRSPALIGADVLRQTTGADGSGIKIAIVDDGIDQTNPFFDPSGYSYPAGFPKGITSATTAKVIVARVFPGPNAGAAGRLPVDPASSFHGTHVAGIAAGDANTTAPAGADHPRTTGLSGVAPRAWLGNYRVFTIPTPIGHVADTPEIVEAFEAAVQDGMDVINFSGGGPEVEPQNDALIAATHAVVAAGVVPVFAAGNDRDDFGNGSIGSPGTAPDAIAVAATSNAHVFAPAMDVPGLLTGIPFRGTDGNLAPPSWETTAQTLVDVGSITGTDGKPVERHLCGPAGALDKASAPLPAGSLRGDIALVERGTCPFSTKADAAKLAGAVGIVYIDNRPGEANDIPTQVSLPGGMIAQQDGARLIALLAARGGKAPAFVGRTSEELDETQRANIITSFSSSGPTDFGHLLKPDVSAPGGQILSSTLANTDASRFAVFDGTSMATPHVSGSAALLLELHPSWTPAQVKSALVNTAAPAYADSDRKQEAPVSEEGGGLVSLPAANAPALFAEPASLSFGDVAPGASKTLLVHLSDGGGGAGTWTVSTQSVDVTAGGLAVVPPAGSTDIAVTVHPLAQAVSGVTQGFILLQNGSTVRRIPYLAFVDNPALAAVATKPLRVEQTGTTAGGTSRVGAYRFPDAPFGFQPDELPMNELGSETVYRTTLPGKLVNAGVSVIDSSTGAEIDPWYLARKDENSVQGYPATPVDVNELTYDYSEDIGVAGVSFPAAGTYYVAVDSAQNRFSGKSLAGRYVLRSWTNDVTPPTLQLLTTRVTAGHPTIVLRSVDAKSGVDPESLTIGYGGRLIAVGDYDPATGLAAFPLPASVAALPAGTTALRMISSDFQESKNVDTIGDKLMPNTRTASARLRVVAGVTIDWLLPTAGVCTPRSARLEVAAGSPAGIARVDFAVDGKLRATSRSGNLGLWSARVALGPGRHVLVVTSVDKKRRAASVRRIVGTCNG
ncbi:MAG: S8 family serine peptidase [Actinomycetota bacterium]